MCKKPTVLFLVFLFSLLAYGQKTTYSSFKSGEELKYLMSYGFIKGGEALLKVNHHKTDSIELIHVFLSAKTLGLTDKIFKVYDVLESYFHPETFKPYVASQNISEGGFKRLYNYEFDHYSREDSSIVNSKRLGIKVMPKNIFDILSALYSVRENFIEEGMMEDQIFKFDTYYNDKYFNFILRYKGKERIKTHLGKIECYVFMPVTVVGRVFETQDALKIYFTADENKLPVSFVFDMFFGKAKCEVVEYSGLKNEFKSLIPKEKKD